MKIEFVEKTDDTGNQYWGTNIDNVTVIASVHIDKSRAHEYYIKLVEFKKNNKGSNVISVLETVEI